MKICGRRGLRNDRGVALIIVLLATALLMALVFEFASGTRISMHSAVNFRDSQRAYYLARSGVNFIGNFLSYNLRRDPATGQDHRYDNLEQREWQSVPFMPGSDMELKVRWEDESSKINVAVLTKGSDAYTRLTTLFTIRDVDTSALDRVSDWMIAEKRNFYLLTELHQFMSDEEYRKVNDVLTVLPAEANQANKINLNTAPSDVLQTIGLDAETAGRIVERRAEQKFMTGNDVSVFLGPDVSTAVGGQWSLTSDVFRVYSFATVGGYTKQVEAVVKRTAKDFKVLYWRAL